MSIPESMCILNFAGLLTLSTLDTYNDLSRPIVSQILLDVNDER